MINIAIAGAGKHSAIITGFLKEDTYVALYLDNDPNKVGTEINNILVYSPFSFPDERVDYIIVTSYSYITLEKQLLKQGVSREKIVSFFDRKVDFVEYEKLLDPVKSIQYRFFCELDNLEKKYDQKIRNIYQNLIYENADYTLHEAVRIPDVCSVEETLEVLLKEKKSISRFGDGELQLIIGKAKDVYQEYDRELAERLREILVSNLDNHIVALADDYGEMRGMSERAKDVIRKYLTREKRKEHYRYLDFHKKYYNAYISRPYIIYPWEEREMAAIRFNELKKIWDNEDLVIIEGDMTRFGVGNDLIDNAKSVKRILAPNEHAYRVYNDILSTACRVIKKSSLVLISLGPTATVLAYDLAKCGYWAIDIGHLDLEYEWFLRGEGFAYIKNKYNNEVLGDTVTNEIKDSHYEDSILYRVGV